MNRKLLLIFILLLSLYAFKKEQSFKIYGCIEAPGRNGNIYLKLVTKDQFSGNKGAIDSILIEPGSNFKNMEYCFEKIPEGLYAIIGYQDVNKNLILDMGMFKPKEPWCMSWQKKHFGPPFFKQCCFTLNANKRIDLKME